METTTQAESSTATETGTLELPVSGSAEYAEWRVTGNLPEKPKPAETAPAETPKTATTEPQQAKPAPGTEPGINRQESRRKPGAEHRIGELTAEIKQLRQQLTEAGKPQPTKAEPSPAKPATYQEWRKTFKPTEWTNQYIAQNKDATWEDAQAALADHMADRREEFRASEQQIAQQRQAVGEKLSEARKRYQDYDTVAAPLVKEMLQPDIPREIFGVLNDSPVLADLLYVIGGDEASKNDFLDACRSNPSKALRVALLMEQDIVKELEKGKENGARNDKGQFTQTETTTTPAKKGPEAAPAPPIEINHRGGGEMDESARALAQIERGNDAAFREWKRAEDRKTLARRRGV
jgi:hypothetical protein